MNPYSRSPSAVLIRRLYRPRSRPRPRSRSRPILTPCLPLAVVLIRRRPRSRPRSRLLPRPRLRPILIPCP